MGEKTNNVNVNVNVKSFLKRNIVKSLTTSKGKDLTINDDLQVNQLTINEVADLRVKNARLGRVDNIALRLMEKLHDHGSIDFFRKCAWHLSEDEIWYMVELATRPKIKTPARYFTAIASREMAKRNC